MSKLIKKIKQFYKKEPKKFVALIFICILLLGFTLFDVVISSRKVESIKSRASERESENRNERLQQRLDEQQNQKGNQMSWQEIVKWMDEHFGGRGGGNPLNNSSAVNNNAGIENNENRER